MKFRHQLPYDASPGGVFAMLAEADFRETVSAAQDVVSEVVTVENEIGIAWLRGGH